MKLKNLLINKRNLKADLELLLWTKDLDRLQKRSIDMVTKYGVKKIQKLIDGYRLDFDNQYHSSALLFHPNLLSPKARKKIQKIGLISGFGPYAFLATVVGMQGEVAEKNDLEFYLEVMVVYFENALEVENLSSYLPTLLNRLTLTLLHFKTDDKLDNLLEIFRPVLNMQEHASLQQNMLLCLFKYQPDFIEKMDKSNLAYSRAIEMKEIMNGKNEQGEGGLKVRPTYAYIPNLSEFSVHTKMVTPENKLERRIVANVKWDQGALWGEPRESHPEGQIIFHIKEVLDNIDKLDLTKEEREKLRFIALVHDTFKYQVDIEKPRVGENNHAVIASKFAKKFTDDRVILDIIELHDEAFNAWRKGNDTGQWNKAEERLQKLLSKLGNNVDLYHKFYKCDNETGSKDQKCLVWFEKQLAQTLIN